MMQPTRQKIIDILFQLASTPAMVLNVNEAADKLLVLFESHCYNRLKLIKRSEQIELLDKYTRFLQKNSYIDTDATCEEPFAIEEFLKELNQSQ